MKKVLLLLVCLFTLQTVVWADDDKPIQVNQLPQTAQTFILGARGHKAGHLLEQWQSDAGRRIAGHNAVCAITQSRRRIED